MLKPALFASLKKSFTVSNENSFKFLSRNFIFSKISGAIVIISDFDSSAWKIFNISRELAHNNSIFFFSDIDSEHWVIVFIGSMPLSAILPANTETIEGVSFLKQSTISTSCWTVNIAVTFTFILSLVRLWIPSAV